MVARRQLAHVDTLDLYRARQRRMFVREAAGELYVEESAIKKDLGRVLLELESLQERLIREAFAKQEPAVPAMTQEEHSEALELLQDPRLLDRILADCQACGLLILQSAGSCE